MGKRKEKARRGELTDSVSIHVLDVGHGDSIVIEFPKRDSFGIVDCNLNAKANRIDLGSHEPKVLSFFRRLKKEGRHPVVEFVCLTHPHHDHYSGMAALLEGLVVLGITIVELWDFGASAGKAIAMRRAARLTDEHRATEELTRLCKAWNKVIDSPRFPIPRLLLSPQKKFWQKHGVTMDLLAPHGTVSSPYLNFLNCETDAERREWRKRFPLVEDDNSISSAFLVRWGKSRILLGGDLTNEAWRLILRRSGGKFRNLGCIAAKVCHHGSLDGNFLEAWDDSDAIAPEQSIWPHILKSECGSSAAVSGGYRSGLPHAKTLNALRTLGVKTFCTGALTPEMTRLHPYIPIGFDRASFLGDLVGEVWESLEGVRRGHGDIRIDCFKNGEARMHSEFDLEPV